MPHVTVNCVSIGQKDRDNVVGFIYRVGGFSCDILVKGFTGSVGQIHWLFLLN